MTGLIHFSFQVWDIQVGNTTAICRICQDGRAREFSNCPAHERASSHKDLLEHYRSHTQPTEPTTAAVSEGQISDNGLRNLLSSLTGNLVDPYPSPHAPSPNLGISWNLIAMNDDTEIPLSAEQQGVANIASAILQRYDELPASDDEWEERSDAENADMPEPLVPDAPAGPGMNYLLSPEQ